MKRSTKTTDRVGRDPAFLPSEDPLSDFQPQIHIARGGGDPAPPSWDCGVAWSILRGSGLRDASSNLASPTRSLGRFLPEATDLYWGGERSPELD